MRTPRSAVAAFCLSAMCAGCAGTIHGIVFDDLNGDGWKQPDEPGLAQVTVALDHHTFTTTDSAGRYTFVMATPAAHVWARVPDGFRPGPVYGRADDDEVDLALTRLTARQMAAPLSFVVGADTHATTSTDAWDGGDLEDAIAQAVALPEPPRFFTIVGDVTQSNELAQFERVQSALRDVDVPWIPVAGNHDWYDGGATWRARFGPDNYSFESGGTHVIVWDTNLPVEDQLEFFRGDLANVDDATTVVALGHDSPRDAVVQQLTALGVDYMFTGHWHANRRINRFGMIEWGTQTMVMGTIDSSPAGYRIVTLTNGEPIIEHRARMVTPELSITNPHEGSCASPSGFELLVSAAFDASVPNVSARLDCGPARMLSPIGGWSYGSALAPMEPGYHQLEVTATTPGGRTLTRRSSFEVCDLDAMTPIDADWPQPGGGPQHTNATPHAITPPLQQLWAASVGGNVLLGSPVIADGTVVITVWDLAGGDQGGVVALDLATGAERWRHTTSLQVRAAPAILIDEEDPLVVIALAVGQLQALSLRDGSLRWTHDAAHGIESGATSLWGAPTIANGLVYVAIQGRMSAVEARYGDVAWERDLPVPAYAWLGSLAAVTVENEAAVANSGRRSGMTSWHPQTGAQQWQLTADNTVAINATPIAQHGALYFANSAGVVTAIDLTTARERWSATLTPDTNDWDYVITATPALAGGRMFVPTQRRYLVALDAATGVELWRWETPGGPLNFAHYRGAEPGFAASVVVTDTIVWVPRPDGGLSALAVDDGRELWSTQLGAPIVSAPAPAGDYLVVATFDGTVRALAPAPAARTPPPLEPCPPEPIQDPTVAGCCSAEPNPPTLEFAIALFALGVRDRYRRRRKGPAARAAHA